MMPFPKQAKHDFTTVRISAIEPNQSGIYGIFNHSHCIYLEKTEDIKESLLQHVTGKSDQAACIFQNDPQYWLAAIVPKSKLMFWERILLGEFRPVCLAQQVIERENR